MASSHDYTLTAKALESLNISNVQPIAQGGDSHKGFLLEARTEAWK